jgi:hypothetical protein
VSRLFITVEDFFLLYGYISVHVLVVHLLSFLSHLPAWRASHLACFLRESQLMLDKWLVSMVWCGVLHAACLLALYGPWVEMVTRLFFMFI